MWGAFLKKRRAQRLGVYRGFMNKVINMVYKTQHKEKQNKNRKLANLHRKTNLKKPLGPNGTIIRMVSRNAGWLEGSPGRWDYFFFFRLLWRKGVPKGAFLKIQKIENGTPKQLFIKVRHWDPSGTLLKRSRGAVSKNMKNRCKLKRNTRGSL